MTNAIEVTGLTKIFRRGLAREQVTAVSDVSLQVGEGEAFGFVGPNGAGKSTTIKMLTGVLKPTSGTITLFGVSADEPLSRSRLGYVPENPYLFDYLTPLEILTTGMRMHRLRLDDVRGHCMRWLERLELAHVAGKPIRTFSKGMTQRVALAQALCIRPRLLVLDEPLSGLDPVGRRDIVDILAEYRREGGTIFFTSHVLHDVERLADRFGLIYRGCLRSVRSPAELAGEEEKVVVRSLGTTPPGEGAREELPGRWIMEVPSSQLWERLETIRRAQHVLVEVRPTLSLESAFMQAIGQA